ncbi:MAG: hypothetical protein FJY21_11680 [Bacteroidetes bacterium]|nr:hypothetical protein [Bacteroidota bacterium]
MNVLKLIAGLFLCTFLISCGPEIEKQESAAKPELIRIPEPFRYHKAIEVKPGLTFDIVSWGRGSDSIGAYLILRSDSTRLSYRSVSGELKGQVFDAWNMDLDNDGNPELYIQSVEKGNDNHLKMYIHEFSDGGSSQPIRFPELNSSLKEGYRGKDSLYIRDGILYREFAFHSAKDSASAVKPLKRKLEYFLKNNSLQFKEIKEDRQSSDKKH